MDNANITINMKQTADGLTDSAELFTRGELRLHKGVYYIDYDETEATGFAGCHTQIAVGEETVNMTRTGRSFSNLVFEGGKRHYCHYGTEFGDCMLGISTNSLRSAFTEAGGELFIRYTLDMNGALIAENEITIKVITK